MEMRCTAASDARAAELDVAHVADVKDADAGAHGHVLGGEAGVFDRHVPAAEVDHLGAELAMNRVECCFAKSWNNGSRQG